MGMWDMDGGYCKRNKQSKGGLDQAASYNRPHAYPNRGYIPVRTNWLLKRASCEISVRTDAPKFSTMYDPGRGQVTPVWTEVRSVMRTNFAWSWLDPISVVIVNNKYFHQCHYILTAGPPGTSVVPSQCLVRQHIKECRHSMPKYGIAPPASRRYHRVNIHTPGIWAQIKNYADRSVGFPSLIYNADNNRR